MGQRNPNVLASPHVALRRQETSESDSDSSDSDSEIDPLEMNNSLELTRVQNNQAPGAAQITNRTDESNI